MKTENELKKGAKAIRSALEKHRSGRYKIERVMKAINKNGMECVQLEHGFTLDDLKAINQLSTTAHLVERGYDTGDNSDRKRGFTHSPYHSVLGKFFQRDIKMIIRKALDTAEWWIEHKYDKDAFVYDSVWLKDLDKFTDEYIEERFQHADYKLRFMHQIRRITYFMAKEDPFYTCVLKEFITRLAKQYPDGIALTDSEQYNLDMWHTGTNEEIRARGRGDRKDTPWMKRE